MDSAGGEGEQEGFEVEENNLFGPKFGGCNIRKQEGRGVHQIFLTVLVGAGKFWSASF